MNTVQCLLLLLIIGCLGACAYSANDFRPPKSGVIEIRPDGPSARDLQQPTKIVVLGSGTPVPDRNRAGSSIAIIHKGQAYLFDVGAGSVQNAVKARYKYDIPALYPSQIAAVFITHMHNDHTLDYVELSQRLWWRRDHKLKAFGPTGLHQMNKGLAMMMAADVATRSSGVQPLPNPTHYQVDGTEIEPGVVFAKDGMTVEAFAVPHGDIKPAYGYKITTPDLTVVISGDTAYSDQLAEIAHGADYLFHEVISDLGLSRNTEFWQNYHQQSHTLASDIGKLANTAQVGTVVLYHALLYGVDSDIAVQEVQQFYSGKVVMANDLDLFE